MSNSQNCNIHLWTQLLLPPMPSAKVVSLLMFALLVVRMIGLPLAPSMLQFSLLTLYLPMLVWTSTHT